MITRIKYVLLIFSYVFIGQVNAQEFKRSVYSVFSSTVPNDSLSIVGGQIMSGIDHSNRLQHGYYPNLFSLASLPEIQLQTIALYPNPFYEVLNIDMLNEQDVAVVVRNSVGQIVLQRSFFGTVQLYTFHLVTGVYLIEVKTKSELIYRGKLVKG